MDRRSQLDEDDEEDEEDEEERTRRRRRRRRRRRTRTTRQEKSTDIKSNNPHLAGGEKHQKQKNGSNLHVICLEPAPNHFRVLQGVLVYMLYQ